jgi:hypothetical protein
MVKKSLKKSLAILLSVLMIATSIPFTAVAASDPTEVVTSAMTDYENMMDGTVYTNMKAAYLAYVKCQEYLDAYNYGGKNLGLAGAATALQNAMDDMTEYSAVKSNVMGSFVNDADNVTANEYSKVYHSLLYSPQTTTDVGSDKEQFGSSWTGSNGTTFYVYYPTTVVLYDGEETPSMGVMIASHAYKTGSWSKDCRDKAAWIDTSSSQGLSLKEEWHGYDKRMNFQYQWYGAGNRLPLSQSGSQYYSHGETNYYWSNILYYEGDFSSGSYLKTINPTFKYVGSNDTDKDVTFSVTGSAPIYVINYKALLTALTNNKAKITLKANLSDFKEGGLAQVMADYDTATSFDPTSYNYEATASAVSSCSTRIKELVELLNNTSSTADGTGFANLRTAITDTTAVYNMGDLEEVYPDGTWATFSAKYEEAANMFLDNANNDEQYSSSTINNTTAQKLADELKTARAALVVTGRVDTATLEIAINNALVAINNKAIFTTSSYNSSNIETVTQNVQVAIWGDTSKYGVDAAKPADSAESQSKVATQLANVKKAVESLVVNTSAVVYDGYSLDTALTYAQPYLDAASDYSNAYALQEAVNKANEFKSSDKRILAEIEDSASSIASEYITLVQKIVFCVLSLTPSFSKITNGTIATLGEQVTTTAASTHGNSTGYWGVDFVRYSGTVIFKTTHEKTEFELPDAQFVYFDKSGSGYDCMLDSINVNAASDTASSELTSVQYSSDTDFELSSTQISEHPGGLSILNGGLTLKFSELYVTSSTSDQTSYLGKDSNGNTISYNLQSSTDFTDMLEKTDGTCPISGGVVIKSSSGKKAMTINAKMTLTSEATSSKLNADSIPKLTRLDTSDAGSCFGIVYYWKYNPSIAGPAGRFRGYSYDRTEYSQQNYIVDISSLIDLINLCEKLDANEYTNPSWSNLTEKLAAAKAEMEYSSMEANEIWSQCVTRYNDLWQAYEALEKPANNDSIKAALIQGQDAFQNDSEKCESTTWDAFYSKYREVYQKFLNEYSNTNVRDYSVDKQDEIDAVAADLVEAYNNLVYYADFSVLNTAVDNLGTTIANSYTKYTVADLNAINTTLNNLTYYTVPANLQSNYYNTNNPGYTNSQPAIDAEAQQITALADTLEPAVIDETALEAKINEIKAQYADPDAYTGVDAAIEAVANMNIYGYVRIGNKNIQGVAYSSQAEIDEALTNLLSKDEYQIKDQEYTVTLDGETVGTYAYGTEVTVNSADGNVADWYYSYVSNTATNTEKYLATDTFITFVIKGNTTLTSKSASVSDKLKDPVKVKYINNLNGRTYKIDYVEAGELVNLDTASAPVLPYYKASSFTVNGATATSFEAVEDVTVVANYVYDSADTFTVTVYNLKSTLSNSTTQDKLVTSTDKFEIANLYYNDEVSFIKDAYAPKRASGQDATIYVDSENYPDGTYIASGLSHSSNNSYKIVNWIEVKADMFDEFLNAVNDGTAIPEGCVELVATGTDYTFRVHENVILIPLDSTALKRYNNFNIIDTSSQDSNGVTLRSKNSLVIQDSQISIISQYVLPTDYTMVETGILFASFGNSTVPTFDLTFANVGTQKAGSSTCNVVRMKSSQHTAGNQYVITMGASKLKGVGDVAFEYAPYIIYKDASGATHEYVGTTVTTTQNF